MKQAIQEILQSKKAIAAISGGLAYLVLRVAGHYGLALDDATAQQIGDRIVLLAGTYVGGQALADHGKEAAQIHADSGQKTGGAS